MGRKEEGGYEMLKWGKICLVLIVIVSASNLAVAKNTQSLKVSCSIPAVPGLNAPAISATSGIQTTANTPLLETQETLIQKDATLLLTSVYAR